MSVFSFCTCNKNKLVYPPSPVNLRPIIIIIIYIERILHSSTVKCGHIPGGFCTAVMHLSMLAPPHPGQGGEFSLFGMADLPQGSGH